MSNKFDEMRQAVSEAKETLRAADNVAGDMASVLIGRLRKVDSGWILSKLKRELRDWDIHRSCWKE